MLEIDGAHSGGQILRTSLSLSVLTQKPFKIVNIRGKRDNPGLQNQHLTAVNAISKICNAQVKGNTLHSKELEFKPSKVIPGNYTFDIGTAGSTILVFQTLLPALLFAKEKSSLKIFGGTSNPLAPSAFYTKAVFLQFLKLMNIAILVNVEKEGFVPKGGGQILAKIMPCKKLKPLILIDRGKLDKIYVFAVSSQSLREKDVAQRLLNGFTSVIEESNLETNKQYVASLDPGCFISGIAKYEKTMIGYTTLGKLGVKSEDIGKECATNLLNEINSNCTVDSFTADQLLLYMALAKKGKIISSKVTEHIKSNIEVIEKFLDVKFKIEGNEISIN